MFILHSSNNTENLVAHLRAVIENAPLESPFAKEVFLIQSQGMERWLSQQLADRFKVWANYEFLFPGKFFSSLAQQIDDRLSDAAFERNLMHWRIEALLRRVDGEEFLPLTQYLSGENIALKRYQLAQQLAQIFDQYQMMRPDMLTAWQQGRLLYQNTTERWQQALWLQITAQTGNRHRGSLYLEIIAKLNAAEPDAFSRQLPERISVFGLNTMPPLFLSYLQALSKHCQLHLFLLNPAQDFWADLAGKRQRMADENFSGHPLLSTLGQQGREFQEMLLEQAQFDFEPESFEPSEARTHLQHLQNAVLNNRADDSQTLKADDSLRIHACHSRMREVEVLKNQLLHTLENDPNLELRDIVVMAPDIQAYEPFISAVFNDIQHAIADRSLRLSNHALDAFIGFLDLSQSRFGWQSVLDLLEQPVVYPGFALSETDLELIRHWVRDTHVRWGKSAQHKQELGLPELGENTWQAMLDRLLMGYAVGSDQDFIDGLLPYRDIEGSSALALGGLCDFMQLLFKAGKELKQAKSLKTWSTQLYYYADQLLAAEPSERQQLNELLAELSAELAAVHSDDVELQVIISWLKGMVAERKSSTGFLRGQLTFCSMLPMRSIPFKVIALLGMNDGEFPKIDRHPTFDLLAQDFRKGDRSHRADDRYQFLEILLSARQQLIMTYIGQSNSHNDAIPPSVVISEMLEALPNGDDLIIRHPLQPFSRRYFDGSADLFSFSEADYETVRALADRGDKADIAADLWWQGRLADDNQDTDVIELHELSSFFRHPQRYFLQRQMDLRFNGIAADAEEREPFNVGKLEAYAIYHEWIDETLNGKPPSVKKLQAQGRWPAGVPGELEFDRQQDAINGFVEQIKSKNLGAPLAALPIDISVGSCRLVGKLGNRYQHGSLFYRYADLKGKDFMVALLHHLLINRILPQPTFLLSTDEDLVLLPEHCQPEYLRTLIEIYLSGRKQPDAFFTEAALAYVTQAYKLKTGNRASKSALDAAIEHLSRAVQLPYEPELGRLYGNVADLGSVLGQSFQQQCQNLLQPVWDALHQ